MKKYIPYIVVGISFGFVGFFGARYLLSKEVEDIVEESEYTNKEKIKEKTYTAEEMKKILRKEMDRRRSLDIISDNGYHTMYAKENPDTYIDVDEDIEDSTDIDKDEEDANYAAPYIISTDAFMNEFDDYSKNTLSYFPLDDVLCDDRNEVIINVEDYIGDEALSSFGEGSDDDNVVYVRNHRKQSDYEICKETGSYTEDVLGIDIDEGVNYAAARKFFDLDGDKEE